MSCILLDMDRNSVFLRTNIVNSNMAWTALICVPFLFSSNFLNCFLCHTVCANKRFFRLELAEKHLSIKVFISEISTKNKKYSNLLYLPQLNRH